MSAAKKATPVPTELESNRRYISFDERGNARWNWKKHNIDPDSPDIDDTFNFMKALDVESLRIDENFVVSSNVLIGDPYNSPAKDTD